MNDLSWGKPKVEVAAFVEGVLPAEPTWMELTPIKEDSATMTTAKGTKKEAKAEGGELVDLRYAKNAYSFTCDVFVKKGATRVIQDVDGIVSVNYAVRLSPEVEGTEGFIFDKALVTVEEAWSSGDGKLLTYTFDALKPAAGSMCKPYVFVEEEGGE